MNVQINASQFDVDEKLSELINRKVSKLERFFDHIIDCQVFLHEEGHSEQNKQQTVEIKVNVKDSVLFCKETESMYEQSIDKAVENMSRQLKKYKDKHN